MNLLDAALAWHDAGACVLPAATNGSKMPSPVCFVDGGWTHYKTHRPTREQVATWAASADGMGIICGAVSGGLEMVELEAVAVAEGMHEQLQDAFAAEGEADLWAKLNTYVEESGSGGRHWMYLVGEGAVLGNTKLARRRDAEGDVEGLAETRGQGGWTVIAPSAGRTHPDGGSWKTLPPSTPGVLPVLDAAEYAVVHRLFRTLDEIGEDERPAPPPPKPVPSSIFTAPGTGRADGGKSPGDDFEERTDWADILEPAGWRLASDDGTRRSWRRPGKKTPGISATTGYGDQGHDLLYVFSTNTEFREETSYSKFGAYARLHHNDDYSAAAKALRAQGYGTPAPEPQRPVAATGTDGLADVVALPEREPHLQAVDESTLDRSDDGNALLLIDRFGALIRFCEDRGAWLAWDGHRWHWCDRTGGAVREYAKRVARALPSGDPAAVKHKRQSLSAGGTSAMLTQAATDRRIAVAIDELDAHPTLLNTPAGVINLITGRLGPTVPEQLHTRATRVTPDADIATPRWDAFLADTFAGHEDLIPFVQRLLGYSLTGLVLHHILPFLFGPGGNGKSVLTDVCRALAGDYAGTAPGKFLMVGAQQHETEIARLSGLRMVICSEINQTDKFDEAKVKLLTGGDTLAARFMRADHFEFKPTHKLWLMGNHQPRVSGGGESFWRRLRIIPFVHTVPEEKKVDGLADLLVAEEGPGILAWIVDGARQVLGDGLGTPDSVKAATKLYAKEEDSLARFLADRCHLGGGAHVRVTTGALRSAYEQWCREEGETVLSSTAFGRELRTVHGIEQQRSNGRRYYIGITVLAPEDDEPAPGAGIFERPAQQSLPHWSDR